MKLLVVSALLCGLMVLTTAAPNSHLVKRSTDCPLGWTRYGDRCFYYSPTVMSWARAEEGIWLWSDGTSFHYSHWCPGEPNNVSHNQHCIQMNHGDSKCWDDVQCDRHLPSVCAKKV